MRARKKVLEFMQRRAYRPMTAGELAKEFQITKKEMPIFKDVLDKLEEEGFIVRTRRDRYGIPAKMNLVVGKLQGNRKGFGFIIPDDPDQSDVYIGLENMKGAMHGDRVIARLFKGKFEGKPEGEIIRILKRGGTKVVGRLEKTRNLGFVIPDDHRIYHDIFVLDIDEVHARKGDKVVVEIEKWPEARRNPEGRIIKVLGSQDKPGVDMESLIFRLELPAEFPPDALQESDRLPATLDQKELEGRLDLRDRFIFTIDGEDAKDFDDAVSLENLEGTIMRLGIHIADVSHYVSEDSPLDREALARGTSIYLVDRVIPMLPENISNNLCSLQPHKDRLVVSLFIDIDMETGKIKDYRFDKSVIKSKYRLTYTEVNDYLQSRREPKDKDLLKVLRRMDHMAGILRKKKEERGSIDFDFPEPYIELDEQGKPLAIHKRVRGPGEMLIEEFMIIANEVIARHFYDRNLPFIYRVHEEPDGDKIKSLNEFIHNFGYHIREKEGRMDPQVFQGVLEKVRGRKEERLVQTMVLRSLKQARYAAENLGHFGLASACYTHFTSPIRRYPDLVVHRLIKEMGTRKTIATARSEQLESQLLFIAKQSSDRERRAMEAERESVDLKMVEFMADRVGEVYDAYISGIMPFGFFAELDNMVEGLVHVSTLTDDYYFFHEKEQALIGERSKKIYRLGDPVRVQVDKVSRELHQIDFVVADE